MFITQSCALDNRVHSVLSDDLESDGTNALRYVPGKARSHHLEMMLSKEELEEEQRSVKTTNMESVRAAIGLILISPHCV